MGKNISRRSLLKTLGLSAGAALSLPAMGLDDRQPLPPIAPDPRHRPPVKPVTAITLGAGARGNVYGGYALSHADELDIVGVAEPIPLRRERYSQKHKITAENQFTTWEHVFSRPKFADAIIITTPDNLHYGPCMKALELGYDVLLEKPIAPTEQECRNILKQAQKYQRIVAVCHVLRYAPYFNLLKQIIHGGSIGELVSIQHLEPIEHIHMSHSYVRGNWHNSKATTPIILAKSCHDLDILRWLVEKPCKRVTAFGGLKWFHQGNAPKGSTARCTDGCAVEASCPYSALKIYHRQRSWTYVFDLPEEKEKQGDAILQYLKTTNYGRCVYKMENDQPDHYITNLEFDNGITASFSMEAFTPWGGRRTRVMGSMGFIEGDMTGMRHYNFKTGKTFDWKEESDGHGGGDWRLVKDWLQAVSQKDPTLLSSTIDASIESHVIGFRAEASRLQGKVMQVRL